MKKRAMMALGAVLASVLLALGVQQAVLLTTAAWTDSVSYTAPVTSGTWSTTPPPATNTAKLTFIDHRTDYTSEAAVIRHVVNIQNSYVDWKNPQQVRELSITVSLPSVLFNESPQNPRIISDAKSPWTLVGAPSKRGSTWDFTFQYGGAALDVNAATGLLTLDFAVSCKSSKSKTITVATTASSPQAAAPATAAYDVKLSDWNCK